MMDPCVVDFRVVPSADPEGSPIVIVKSSDGRLYWCYGDRTEAGTKWTPLPALPPYEMDE